MQVIVKDLFNKDRKTLYMILSIVLVSLFSLTVVYAALSVTLNINGNADVVASNWDIHLDNAKVTSGSVNGSLSITSSTTATFSTTLSNPGDYYEFSIDVVNGGTIDAMIDSITKTPNLTAVQAKYLNYIVEYQNGAPIDIKQLVEKNCFVRLKIRVEFRKDITVSDLPASSEILNLAFTVNYVQSDGANDNVFIDNSGKSVKVVNGSGIQTGDEICIDTECFYVISSNESNITMLAKYNLYVGGKYNVETKKWTAYDSLSTGKQDLTMVGSASNESIRNGTVSFSSNAYWSSTVSSYPAYVYNSNSNLYSYVEDYKKYLTSLGVFVIEARLITYDELIGLGCNSSGGSCSTAPKWVSATSFWSGSATTSKSIWDVNSTSNTDEDYNDNDICGVRPVIIISKNYL